MNKVYKINFYAGSNPEVPISLGFDSSFIATFAILEEFVKTGPIKELEDLFYSLELLEYDLVSKQSETILLVALELKDGTWHPVRRQYLEEEIDRFYLCAAEEDFNNLEEYDDFFMKFHIQSSKLSDFDVALKKDTAKIYGGFWRSMANPNSRILKF